LPFFRCWTANQRSGHCSNAVNGINGKTFPSIPFSRATATVATERNYGNGTMERQNGTTEWQRQHGNGMVETRHHALPRHQHLSAALYCIIQSYV